MNEKTKDLIKLFVQFLVQVVGTLCGINMCL